MKSREIIRFKLFVLLLVLSCFNDYVSARLVKQFTYKDFPRYQTLKELSEGKEIKAESIKHLEKVLDTVFYENKGRTPQPIKINQELGLKYITLTQWNMERGFNIELIQKIIRNPSAYLKHDIKTGFNDAELKQIKSELDTFRETDIFILNELDWGIHRTAFKNIAANFAHSLGAEYVFAPEFIELSPELVNKSKNYKGLHGNAIISRFPIKNPRILKLPVTYDWYEEELKKKSPAESVRRTSSKVAIKEEILTELRQGARIALIADILLPNGQLITVLNAHLENRTEAKGREEQMLAILNAIKDIKNPVILAGDLNNFENSAEATSIKRIIGKRIGDPLFISKAVINYFNPYALSVNAGSTVIGFVRKHRDPTVLGVPLLLPNKSRKLFDIIHDFKFTDNNQFDFSGDEELSYDKKDGKLSNSNERAGKGFVETYKFKRSFGVAKYKIDWIFVKPLRYRDCDATEDDVEELDFSCKNYFPAFGRTLKALNYSPRSAKNINTKEEASLSDHNPVSVRLMFKEVVDKNSLSKRSV